ncbi:hypothetical protein FB645_000188 [Coemansia sp. IMI 203386]|nr:hypothetical protein FB645_000188 [Coemansia sp. IMI 203386]
MKAAIIFTLVLATISAAQSIDKDHGATSIIGSDKRAPLPSPITTLVANGAKLIKRDGDAIAVSSTSSSSSSEPASDSEGSGDTVKQHGRKGENEDIDPEENTDEDENNNKEDNTKNKSTSSKKIQSTTSSTSASAFASESDKDGPSSEKHQQNSNAKSSSNVSSKTSQSQSSTSPTVSASAHCDTNDETMCDSDGSDKFFKCVDNEWVSMTCSSGNECRTVKNKAVCMDPNDPTPSDADISSEAEIPCNTLNSTMCDSNEKSNFYMCIDYVWAQMQCDGNNVCMERNGKTSCVDEQTADTPLESCSTANATQCIDGSPQMFQICQDNYWTNSTCSKDTYCLQRNGNSVCVDKATAEAPVLPCKSANATRCIDDDDSVFQICYDNFWTNSTCDTNYVCGMKQGSAVCHDPKIPLIDVPDQPCDNEKALRCVPDNSTIYQLCYNKLWSNLTCTAGNVCHDEDGEITCMDETLASIEGRTFVLSKAEKFKAIGAASTIFTSHSWVSTILLAAVTMAFGAGI